MIRSTASNSSVSTKSSKSWKPVRKLGQAAWKAIRAECAGRVGSVLELLQGRLSDHVLRVVTDPDRGLFPKPGEITFTCDCPDWAVMCKHAAAVLYGVGSRLDDRPELVFRLRDVDAEDLVVGDMALPDAAAGDDVLAGDLTDLFGIDLDPADSVAATARQRVTGRRRPRRGRPRRTGAPPTGFQPTGRRVAELRHQGGFSVPEFAGLLRVSGSTVYRWEAAGGPLVFSVNYFCRLAPTIFAGSGRRESRSTTMTPVGRVGVACDVQSGVENALPRRCTVAPLLARVFHAAGAVHRLLGFRSIPAFRRSTVGGRGAAADPEHVPGGTGAAGISGGTGPCGSSGRRTQACSA